MGFFDGSIAGFFKRNAEGREIFFIRGTFGRGRMVPSEAEGAWLRRYLKAYQFCVIAGVIPMVLIGGKPFETRWLWSLGAYALLVVAAALPLRLRTRNWQIADERMTYRESMSASAQAHAARDLWFLIVLSILMMTAGLFILLKSDEVLAGVLLVGFFGACLGSFIWMLQLRRRG